MPGRPEGKLVMVTGGTSGIGRASAELFNAEDARVVVADITECLGEGAVAFNVGVSDSEQVAALPRTAVAEFGGLDVLPNNPGIDGRNAPLEDTPDWDINRLPRQLDHAVRATADYLDAVVAHLEDSSLATDASIESARRTAETCLTTVTETVRRANREPRRSQTRTAARTIDALRTLNTQCAALTTLPPTRTTHIPQLRDYRRRAVTAIHTTATQANAAVAEIAALETIIDRMHQYLYAMHAQRLHELRAQPDSETNLL